MQDGHHDDQGQSLYSHFCISGRDIAAFFTDGGSDIQTRDLEYPSHSSQLTAYSLVDRCGIVVIVDQVHITQTRSSQFNSSIVHNKLSYKAFCCACQLKIKVPHPYHPSTRVSVQVPTLGIHLSPSRFSRLMGLLKILTGTIESGTKLVEDYQAEHSPWSTPDLATDVQILVWRVCVSFGNWYISQADT